MSKRDNYYKEKENKRTGKVISIIVHALLLLLFLIPIMVIPEIPDSGSILIAFGEPDAGSVTSQSLEETQSSSPPTAASASPIRTDLINSTQRDEEAHVKASDIKSKPKENINTDTKKNAEAKAAANTKARLEAEKLAQEKAAKDKAAKEAAELANTKKKYSDLFGKGNNNNTGSEGRKDGDPDGKALEGMSKGSGIVGGGLSGRGIEYTPSFSDNSQKTGRVSLSICVNNLGKVSKADYTQKGSTTSDAYLIDLAKKTAMKYKFSKSEIDSQCGTVTIDFKLQ